MPPNQTFTYDDLGRPAEWQAEFDIPGIGLVSIRESMWATWQAQGFEGRITVDIASPITSSVRVWRAIKLSP